MTFNTRSRPAPLSPVEDLATRTAEVEAAAAARDVAERTHKAMEHAFDLATGEEREELQTQCVDARQAAVLARRRLAQATARQTDAITAARNQAYAAVRPELEDRLRAIDAALAEVKRLVEAFDARVAELEPVIGKALADGERARRSEPRSGDADEGRPPGDVTATGRARGMTGRPRGRGQQGATGPLTQTQPPARGSLTGSLPEAGNSGGRDPAMHRGGARR